LELVSEALSQLLAAGSVGPLQFKVNPFLPPSYPAVVIEHYLVQGNDDTHVLRGDDQGYTTRHVLVRVQEDASTTRQIEQPLVTSTPNLANLDSMTGPSSGRLLLLVSHSTLSKFQLSSHDRN
jgi:hypothetical protein